MLKLVKTSFVAAAVLASSVVASDILATVNGKNITKQDAEVLVKRINPKVSFSQIPPADQKKIVDGMIKQKLFAEQAQREGIDKTPQFKELVETFKDNLLVQMWMQSLVEKTVVSDSEAKAFYEKNKEKFMQPETVHARHILVKTEKDAKAIIDKLKGLSGDKLKSKFIELAKSESKGPSASKGGDLGTFKKGQMVPEFSKAVWSLNPGEITKSPVKTQYGYHVILLEEKNEAKPVAYEDVKEKVIVPTLKRQEVERKFEEIAKELRAKAKITSYLNETNTTKK